MVKSIGSSSAEIRTTLSQAVEPASTPVPGRSQPPTLDDSKVKQLIGIATRDGVVDADERHALDCALRTTTQSTAGRAALLEAIRPKGRGLGLELRKPGSAPDSSVERRQLLAKLAGSGITQLHRFAPADLRRILADRHPQPGDTRPVALVVYPRVDPNGAFEWDDEMRKLQSHYRVVYAEAGSDQELANAIVNDRGVRADLLIIGGHGDQLRTQFGAGTEEGRFLDHGDLRKPWAAELRNHVKPRGIVVLASCSTGRAGNTDGNVANLASRFFPDSTIYAPRESAGVTRFAFGGDGRVSAVSFEGASAYTVAPR